MKNSLTKSRRNLHCAALMCSTAILIPVGLQAQQTFNYNTPQDIFPNYPDDQTIFDDIIGSDLPLSEGVTLIFGKDIDIEIFDQDFEYAGIDLVDLFLNGVTVVFNGTIRTSGDEAFGGPIDADKVSAEGIYVSEADNFRLLNNGEIYVGDHFSNAIQASRVSNSTFINTGKLVILEEAAEEVTEENGETGLTSFGSAGIRVNSVRAFFDDPNDPEFVTSAEALSGNTAINNGEIVSEVLQSRGIYLDGARGAFYLSTYATAINNGTIRMLAETDPRPAPGTFDVSGLRAEGHDNTLINNGFIEINPEGFGIDINGANGTILNTGTILSYGDNSHGIEHYRNGSTLPDDLELSYTANTGLVSVEGENSHGVTLSGNVGHVFENSGSVFSRNGYSIEVTDGGLLETGDRNIIRLLDGSLLFGSVFVGESVADHTSVILDDGLNATVRFAQGANIGNGAPASLPAEIRSHHNSHYFDPGTNAVYVADLDSYAQQDQAFFNMTQMLQDAVEAGSSAEAPENSFAFAANDEGVWTRAFGGGLFAGSDSTSPGYDAFSFGVVAGKSHNSRGFFGGLAYTTVSGDEDISYDTDIFTLYGGLSGEFSSKLDYSLMAGVSYNQTDRDVADNGVSGGIDTTDSDYASVFISPAITHAGPIEGSSIRLRYVGLWQQDHDFDWDGGTEISVDSRFSNLVETRFQMEHDTGVGTIAYGLDAIWSDGNDMSFELMGADLTSPYDDGLSSRAFVRYDSKFGHFEVGYDSEDRTTVDFGLEVSF